MENLNCFIDAIDEKNTYNDFINDNSTEMENIFTNLHNYIRNTLEQGLTAGKVDGIKEGKTEISKKVIINLIKFTELDDGIICKAAEIRDVDDHWIKSVKDTREKIKFIDS